MSTAQHTAVVRGLTVTFPKVDGTYVDVVKNVDFEIGGGEIVGLVGESGSGKTMVGLSLLDLIPPPGIRRVTSVMLNGVDISDLDLAEREALRGRDIAMIFQDPMTSFNPVRSIGSMMLETVKRHQDLQPDEAHQRCIDALRDAGVPSPEERLNAFPHQLSGGLRQRAMIALSMLNNPSLLIADEPTTALDATIQSQILRLLKQRLGQKGMILVTHDLGIAAETCDRIIVMRRGRFVEQGPTTQVVRSPQHSYTKELMAAVPSFHRPYVVSAGGPNDHEPPLLQARDVRVTFESDGKEIHAVNGVDVSLRRGETVGLVGESGSGKSTLVGALMGIHRPTAGTVLFGEQQIDSMSGKQLVRVRRHLQLIFQDPYSSLNPRWTVRQLLSEPLRAHKIGSRQEVEERVSELICLVGLPGDALDRRAAQFSGGQRQRIAIARALALEPHLLIADEPVSALDVSVQAQIVSLLRDLQERLSIGYLVVAHDLALMHHIADRILVMYFGRIVEAGETKLITRAPAHPYTAALLSAAPDTVADRRSKRISLEGEQPSLSNPPTGCAFRSRCPIAADKCAAEPPILKKQRRRQVACHFPGELAFTTAATKELAAR